VAEISLLKVIACSTSMAGRHKRNGFAVKGTTIQKLKTDGTQNVAFY